MDRAEALLQGLRAKLLKWQGWIDKTSFASSSFQPLEGGAPGEFKIVMTWSDGKGGSTTYEHLFTKQYAFSRTIRLSPEAWSVDHCASHYAREVVRAVLDRRLQ